ncbi:MAG: penicillin acylase family protein [Bacteroidota bacterium]
MRWVKFLLSLILTGGLLFVLHSPMGPVTFSVGQFFSPFHGFWQNAPSDDPQLSETISLPALTSPVKVVMDDRRVPHIFAENDTDLAYVQGYITARDRLWQMEFQIFAASGRLTEILPEASQEAALGFCKNMRRLGMVFAAERAWQTVKEDKETRLWLESYSEGVNTYIHSLSPSDYPIEYKLLNYTPEEWSPLKSCLLMKYLAYDLASGYNDIEYTNALQKWGKGVFDILYPTRFIEDDPIVPTRTKPDYAPIPPVTSPDTYYPDSMLLSSNFPFQEMENLGSNNWAVSGSKTNTGSPILANDPHLGLNLPAIWYEVQLQTPEFNSYGASFPGSPAVILGFNDSIAWGSTNAGRDVLDLYKITFRDETKSEYLFDGQWMKAEQRIEVFGMKGNDARYDTVIYTHIGPVIFQENTKGEQIPLAIRWMAHEPSNEGRTFIKLNKAKNYEDYLNAIKTFQCPAQNLVFASRAGDIAIWQQGKFPQLWEDQGRFILDGSKKEHMWNQYIPQNHNPHVLNPERGFVSSANQHPTDDTYTYPYYGVRFEAYRNRRLNQLLASKDTLDVQDMMDFQMDTYSVLASDLLPLLLQELDTATLSATQMSLVRDLRVWDFQYKVDATLPAFFEEWKNEVFSGIWDDEFAAEGMALRKPLKQATSGILRTRPDFSFYDNINTPELETRAMIINSAFQAADSSMQAYNENPTEWGWAEWKGTSIQHLARLAPFSRFSVPAGGYSSILNATSRRAGPSWRMIVSLGEEIEAYGIYPGGQSGNPGDPTYDAFIDDWAKGEYYKLWFMKNQEDKEGDIAFTQTFTNK